MPTGPSGSSAGQMLGKGAQGTQSGLDAMLQFQTNMMAQLMEQQRLFMESMNKANEAKMREFQNMLARPV
eukprot:3842384-Karenia_brevis.AAC.1